MNKRIIELVNQVANDMPGVYNIEYESGNKGVEFTEQALEKLTQLIVQECIDIAASIGEHGSIAAQEMRQHFGVEL